MRFKGCEERVSCERSAESLRLPRFSWAFARTPKEMEVMSSLAGVSSSVSDYCQVSLDRLPKFEALYIIVALIFVLHIGVPC